MSYIKSNDYFLDCLEEARMIEEGYDFKHTRNETYLDPFLRLRRFTYVPDMLEIELSKINLRNE
jgi:hypothetical protein